MIPNLEPHNRMTARSIIIGIVYAAFLCAVAQFNRYIMGNGYLAGHFFPVGVFGPLVIFLMFINPLLKRIHKSLMLTGKELAVIVLCALFVSFVPNMMEYFVDMLIMPHQLEKGRPAWHPEKPALVPSNIKDWPVMVTAIQEAAGKDKNSPDKRAVQTFPSDLRQTVLQHVSATNVAPSLQEAIVDALNKAVKDQSFFRISDFDGQVLPPATKALLEKDRNSLATLDVERLNRKAIEIGFPSLITRRKMGAVESIPKHLLVQPDEHDPVVLDGYVAGMAEGDEIISVKDVPWYAWRKPLTFWLPTILAMCTLVIGLSLVVHRQWAQHEHVPYPIAEVASAFIPDSPEKARGSVFENRLFWIAFLIVFLIHLNNYAYAWFPKYFIRINMAINFNPLIRNLFPGFTAGSTDLLCRIFIVPSIIGITYFLRTDISLSFGLSAYLYAVIFSALAVFGIGVGGSGSGPLLFEGAFVGIFVAILYTGRQYYKTVFRRCFFLPVKDKLDSYALWGSRMAVASVMALMFFLIWAGFEWQLALAFIASGILIHVVLSRIIAETGIFLYKPLLFPISIIMGIMGNKALGPHNILLIGVFSTALFIAPQTALAPFVVNAFKLASDKKIPMGRCAMVGVAAIAIGLLVACGSVVYQKYQYGHARVGQYWAFNNVPRRAPDIFSKIRLKLESQGSLEESYQLSGWKRFKHIAPDKTAIIGFSTMFILVLVFMSLRLKFARWPFHPILFVGLGSSWVNCWTAGVLLLGCLIKFTITKYGGARLYQKMKPFMIGLIAGDVVALFLPVIVGAIYYLITKQPPKGYVIFPV